MTESFTTTLTVDSTPEEVSAAIARPAAWWNELIEGSARDVGDEFGFDMPGVHRTRMRVTESDPGRRTVWHVLDNHFSFVDDQAEWIGTDVVFEVARTAAGTVVTVTHEGLVPELQCYEVCHDAWTHFLDAGLRSLLATGTASPMTAELAEATARDFAAAGRTRLPS
ncbi:SRPBCC family protein [Nocardioides sp. GXQ0305]|uniref:SRPBCC family protein n=1 Tax=Nocardioides sp. GXQ0305 TaxID=3423912 RepID=UPI003D7E5691